jgi:IS5 family transposase
MKKYTTVYGDLLSPLKQIDFTNIVKRYKGDYRARRLTTLDLLKVGIYGHTTGASGQREIVTSLAANENALYHCGLKKISLSTFSDALAHHDWRIFEKTFYALLSKALPLTNAKKQHFKNPLKLIDSSTIELCLQKCDWAKYQKTKGAVKIHTRIDGDTYLPEQMIITNGNVHDVNLMDHLTRGKGVIFVMDRGYVDFHRLHEIASTD